MGSAVTLVRPDGSTLQVNPEDASPLLSLGYKQQSAQSEFESSVEQGRADYLHQPGERLQTLAEGAVSGATFGVSDLFHNDEDVKERAQYNPGYRLGGEIIGGFASPAGLIGDAAKGAVEARGIGTFGQTVVKTAAEGAAFGAGGSITNAEMSGDPLTAEAIMAGAGWGAVWGGGLGLFAGKAASSLEAHTAEKAAAEANAAGAVGVAEKAGMERAVGEAQINSVLSDGLKERNAALKGFEDYHYNEFMGTLGDVKNQVTEAVDTIKQGVAGSAAADFSALKASKGELYNYLVQTDQLAPVRESMRGAEKTFMKAQRAAEEGNFKKMESALKEYEGHLSDIEATYKPLDQATLEQNAANRGAESAGEAGATGIPSEYPTVTGKVQANQPNIQELLAYSGQRMKAAAVAGEEGVRLAAIKNAVGSLPRSVEEFRSMTGSRVEKISAAIDSLNQVKAAEFVGLKNSVNDAVTKFADKVGLKVDGMAPSEAFRVTQSALKEAGTARAREYAASISRGENLWGKANNKEAQWEAAKRQGPGSLTKNAKGEEISRGGKNFLSDTAGLLAEHAAGKLGVGRYAAFRLTKDLAFSMLGLKGAVLGKIGESVEKWAPKGVKALTAIAPRADALKRRLDGTVDQGKKSQVQLMKDRAEEIRNAAPAVRDTLYKSISPLAQEHPDLAAAMHALGVQQFQYILNKLPLDPGGAFSALKSLWNPDPAACAKFERCYAVFQDPVGEITKALDSGKVTPELVEGLKEMHPEMYQELRVQMLERISEPAVWKSMTYPEQVNIGLLMDLPVHSTMRPKFIAAQQQMYMERNPMKGITPQAGSGASNGGRPAGPAKNPGATTAQKVTER